MKKLMIALSAAAVGFGLQAVGAQIAGDDFNNTTTWPVGRIATAPTGWSAVGDSAVSDTAFSFSKSSTVGEPNEYQGGDALNNIAVNTPLTTPMQWATGAQDMGNALYFDSIVKFTAVDPEDTVTAIDGAKLMVWVQSTDENDTARNLMITAGYLSNEDNTPTAKTYNCGLVSDYGVVNGDDWCRLTIKAIGDISTGAGVSGFVVFVNGQPATITGSGDAITIGVAGSAVDSLKPTAQIWKNNKQLIPSLVAQDATINAVGFAGKGGIDDISLTTEEPTDLNAVAFAKDSAAFFLNWTPADVTAVSYNGQSVDNVTSGKQLIPVAAAMSVAVTVTYAEGKMAGTWTLDGEPITGTTFAVPAAGGEGTIVAQNAAATFNGQSYATVADAVDAANDITAAGDYTLVLINNDANGGIEVNTKNGVNLIIDLAGKKITAAADDTVAIAIAGGTVMITNSVTDAEGIVDAGEATAAVAAQGGNVLITAGTYDGLVALEGADSATITGGKFDDQVNDADTLKDFLAEGLALVDDNGYYVVSAYTGPDPDPDQENTFLIKTEQDLRWVAEHLADYQTAKLIQTADIDLGGKTFPAIGANNAKDTLGSNYASFKDIAFQGTYDGQNHAITGVVVEDADYGGFFGSVCEATIKNMKMGIVNGGVSDNKECVALFVGVAAKSTLQNLTTIKGTVEGTTAFTSGKDGAGIVAYMAGGTLDSCTNNLDIVFSTNVDNRKGGGIAIITQAGTTDATKVTIKDCVNNGNVSTQKTANNGIGGIVGLVSLETEFDGCVNNGTVSAGSGSWIGDIGGLCSGSGKATVANMTPKATMLTFGRTASAGNTDGALFAKDGAFVANANVVAGDPAPTYVVMSGMTNDYAFAFSQAGAIAFDQSLFVLPKLNVTGPTGYTVTPETSGNVTTYTCAAIPVSSVTISGEKEVKVGETITLTASVLPAEALEQTVTWKSSNDSLATVTAAGVVTGVAAGKVTITATAGGVDGTYEVEVKSAAPADWPEDPSTVKGKTAAEVFGLTGDIATADAADVASWAKGNGKVNFADKAAINVKAMLLNVENTDDTSSAEADFKFSAEDLAALMKGGDDAEAVKAAFETKYPYAAVEVKNSNVLPLDSAKAADGNAGFYQAVLSVKAAPVKEN